MSAQPSVKVYDSRGADYQEAFRVFLAHTDQKTNASAWLEREVAALPRREVFIDAGAGTGALTAWLQPRFRRTIAVEPNAALRDDLRAACPAAEVLGANITAAEPGAAADFVLCSHVFYYIDRATWPDNLRRLADWLRPGGVLAVALQNPATDCMRMLHHFTGQAFDLSAAARALAAEAGDRVEVRIDTVPAHVRTATFEPAYVVAEFMLNLLPLPSPPSRADLERYVNDHFRRPDGSYLFSCHQDFLRVGRLIEP